MMNFEELDQITRKYMLEEFQNEQKSGNPYKSERMNLLGLNNVAKHIEETIKTGNESTLFALVSNPNYWNPSETRHRGSTIYQAKIDPTEAARMFSLTEFNTWYVRGLSKRLMSEGVGMCEIYRAETAAQPRCECSKYEGQPIETKKIYDGHRAKYHPVKNSSAFSIPSGPNCHHTIRRLKKNDV